MEAISFVVPAGSVVGLLGPNGAGKTTTMRMLTGCLQPSEGTARIAGHDVLRAPHSARAHVGYLPERPPLYEDMTVLDYLDHAARLRAVPGRSRAEAVRRVVRDCDLSGVAGRLIARLSTGLRQRVGIAQALVHRPPVLILDEPTSGLDPAQMRAMRQLIAGLAGRHTILLSTHLLAEVTAICQRIVILAAGRVVAAGTEDEVRRALGEGRTIRLRVSGEAERCADQLRGVPAVLGIEREGRDLLVTLREDADEGALAALNGAASNFGLLSSLPVHGLEALFLAAIERGGGR